MKKYTLWIVPDDAWVPQPRFRDVDTGLWADDVQRATREWVPAQVAEAAKTRADRLENAIRRFEDGERIDFQAILDGLEEA